MEAENPLQSVTKFLFNYLLACIQILHSMMPPDCSAPDFINHMLALHHMLPIHAHES